jgi:DNA-binding beta-propeller fold protein YncE
MDGVKTRGRWWLLGLAAASFVALAGCSSTPKAEPKAAVTGSYAFWPVFPDEPRVQFINAYDGSEDVASTKTSGLERIVFGEEAARAASINKPYGLAMRDGKIYVCDIRGKSLMVLDLAKKQTRLVGTAGANRLEHPVAVAVADDGGIYVADNERNAVVVFDKQERYQRVIGYQGWKPANLAIHADRLYVCDMQTQLVVIFNRLTGEKLGTIGTVGDEDGQFRLPLGIATDRKGSIYVADMMRCRIQKFAPDGTLEGAFGSLGDYAGTFARPKHIAVDNDGIIYVVDASFQNVQLFDDQFRLLMAFGASGEHPGAMELPVGVAVDDGSLALLADRLHPGFEGRRLIAVTNQFGAHKVSVYALGEKRAGYSAADLAKASVKVSTGTGVPSAERLRLQEIGQSTPENPDDSGQTPETPPEAPATPPSPPK